MDKIMVGDIVKVNPNNAEHSYSLYFEWFTFYKVKEEKYEPSLPPLKDHIDVYDEDYIVKWIAPHLCYDKMLYAIEGIDTGRVFLVDRDAIAGYYHTENSTDCCYDVNERLLTQEVFRLNSEIDTLKWEIMSLKEKLGGKSEEEDNTNVEINPMPRLKNGMFGITRYKNITSGRFEGYEYYYFVVIEEQNDRFRLIYENNKYEIVGKDFDYGFDIDFNFDGVNEDMTGEIVCLMDAESFKMAKNYMSNKENRFLKPKVIWEKYPKGC